MLEAQLRGKLTGEQENLEDLLTSNVFGSIKYVPLEEGLLPILQNAENEKGEFPLKNIGSIVDVKYEFWPWIPENSCKGCEPDVLITIMHKSGKKTIVLVEAKYLSGKSSESIEKYGPNDQLAREWGYLLSHTEKEIEEVTLVLLYITAHIRYPQTEIEESKQDFIKWLPKKNIPNIIWMSWRNVTKLFFNSKKLILADVAKILVKQEFEFYSGIYECVFNEANWHFKPKPMYLSWSFKDYPVKWRFTE